MGVTHSSTGRYPGCPTCDGIDTSAWLFCMAEEQASGSSKARSSPRRRRAKDAGSTFWHETLGAERLEELTRELFKLHDLNNNGVLEEAELIRLNQTIAVLHHGRDADTAEVKSKYKRLFREQLDRDGHPVPYETFRAYAREVLESLDSDPEAQEMILEQFVAEAQSGRQAFNLELLLPEARCPLKEGDIPLMLNKVLEELVFEELDFNATMNPKVEAYKWHARQLPMVPACIIDPVPAGEAEATCPPAARSAPWSSFVDQMLPWEEEGNEVVSERKRLAEGRHGAHQPRTLM